MKRAQATRGQMSDRRCPYDTDIIGRTNSISRPRATGRWRFLADASAALDTSIDYEQTLANTVRLAVPEVADYCVIVLLSEDGSTRWADSAHRDPTKQAILERVRGFGPPIAPPEHPLTRALRTGTTPARR